MLHHEGEVTAGKIGAGRSNKGSERWSKLDDSLLLMLMRWELGGESEL